jgi:hypothetical protein
MVQTTTTRYHNRLLPGHVSTPEGAGRETESIAFPYSLQTFTYTLGGGGSPMAAGDYVIPFVTPANGTINVTVTSDGTKTFAAGIVEFAAAVNATAGLSNIIYATSNGATVMTTVAKSPDVNLADPVPTVPGADTITVAETVAPAAPNMRMGIFYVYGAPTYPVGGVINTPRQCRLAALPTTASAAADLRGVIGRVANQTTLASDFNDATTNDQYKAGQIAFGVLRGEVDVVVDPASGTFSALTEAVYVVVGAGTYSVIGSVADAADGGNTVRLDNTTPVRARVTEFEETNTFNGGTLRCVRLRVNQTN